MLLELKHIATLLQSDDYHTKCVYINEITMI